MIVQLTLLIALMLVCTIGPGLIIARPLRLSPMEKLCVAPALSFMAIYLLATGIYISGISWHWAYVGSLASLLMLLISWKDLRQLLANHAVRRTLAGFGILFLWLLLLLLTVRTYSGGRWSGDWIEHYDRTQFFLHRYPLNHLFIGLYLLPARPPMMNLIAAFFLAQVSRGFPAFELCFALLNLCAVFPAALLLDRFATRGQRAIWILVAALASSPFFAENTTYAWTKLFSAFFVVLGIALYLHKKPVIAFVMLAAACLVHYSAGVFAIFLAAHYLWTQFRKRMNWRQLGSIVLLCGGLLASWFGWSVWKFGLHQTMATNTAATDAGKLTAAQNLAKIGQNIYAAIVPVWLTNLDPRWASQSTLGLVRDQTFIWYQQNLLLMMGSAGAVVMLWIIWRTLLSPQTRMKRKTEGWFWLGLIIFCVPAAIATHGALEPYGNAHVVLQPMVLLGIAAIAAYAPRLPRWAWRLLVLGWAIDFFLGILLQFYLENQTFEALRAPDGTTYWMMPIKLMMVASENFNMKQAASLHYLGDMGFNGPHILIALAALEFTILAYLLLKSPNGYASGSRRAIARKFS